MTKDEALLLALEVLEELENTQSYWWQEVDEVTTKKIDPTITAIKATLEAKDEPEDGGWTSERIAGMARLKAQQDANLRSKNHDS
jgi:hypothetical protein